MHPIKIFIEEHMEEASSIVAIIWIAVIFA